MENEILDDNFRNEEHQNSIQKFGGFWLRVGASILDMFILSPIMFIAFYNNTTLKIFALSIILNLLSFLYKPLLEGIKGATLGKMVCTLKVVSEDDYSPISVKTSFYRNFPQIAFFILGILITWKTYSHPDFLETTNFFELGMLVEGSILGILNSVLGFVFLIIIIFVAFDKKKRGLHDMVARTVVIIK